MALGTDGAASNNNLNMLEELHLAAILHNGYRHDAAILPAAQVLDMATINGAKLQGRDDTGAIEAGKRADIMAIDLSAPHLVTHLDTAGGVQRTGRRRLHDHGGRQSAVRKRRIPDAGQGADIIRCQSRRQAAVRRVREKENTHGTSRQGPCLYDAV